MRNGILLGPDILENKIWCLLDSRISSTRSWYDKLLAMNGTWLPLSKSQSTVIDSHHLRKELVLPCQSKYRGWQEAEEEQGCPMS